MESGVHHYIVRFKNVCGPLRVTPQDDMSYTGHLSNIGHVTLGGCLALDVTFTICAVINQPSLVWSQNMDHFGDHRLSGMISSDTAWPSSDRYDYW